MAKNDSILVALARSPWWWSLGLAAVAYFGLRYGAPWLASLIDIHFLKVLLMALSHAWWIAIVFLLPLPWSLYRAIKNRW